MSLRTKHDPSRLTYRQHGGLKVELLLDGYLTSDSDQTVYIAEPFNFQPNIGVMLGDINAGSQN